MVSGFYIQYSSKIILLNYLYLKALFYYGTIQPQRLA